MKPQKLSKQETTEEIEQIKRDLEKLKMTVLDKGETAEDIDLSRKERAILDYIQNHPGVSKQGLVDGLDGQYSRVPIYDAITFLDRNQMIVIRKDKHNSQVHRLFINDDSLLLALIHDLDSFEKNYLQLLRKVQKNEPKGSMMTIYAPFTIYQHLLGMYLIHSLQTWPRQTDDPLMLKRLYTTLFSRLSKIHLEIYKIHHQMAGQSSARDLVWHDMIKRSFLIHYEIRFFHWYCNKIKAVEEFENVMDVVWRISYDFFPLSDLWKEVDKLKNGKEMDKFRDWRELLKLRFPKPT